MVKHLADGANVLAVFKEHPEFSAPNVVAHFEGRPGYDILKHAQAASMDWDDDNYDVEADFLGALAAVRRAADKAMLGSFAGRRPSELSDEEKALLLATLQGRKPDGA